ncbi:hypothetical protein [Methanococcus maripaludis]|jgi:hypothetical protein|uniref:Uncharacterized protein n=5 Tax=Methanococcus maripaludis TaxID=39152 RepID=A0A2L1CBF8_METMI|nr:hypothetical protein [Methanococcus maripaludis]MDK2929110.1 hypothetical protein [Methanococcus sp.]AEK20555.1 hypothetical protein GYY_08510 [Methanococcus maripaludis X1]AVB76684.1 hypothetical protein MMJJ_13050 [Methanococcus maripaludis]MBA2839683.1 hypothetical protein [Methanococcus maripaludis]MBA2847433.1 hypothetical protein [Methanococcus maripaludis]
MFKKIKRIFVGNKELPTQVPVQDEEYVVIGQEYSAYEIKESEKIPIQEDTSENKVQVIKHKIYPRVLTTRIKSPQDFEYIKNIVEHDVILINLEEVPIEAIIKEFNDFKKYLETLDYSLGRVGENTILAIKSDVEMDKYVSEEPVHEVEE